MPYRNDAEAIREHHTALERQLAELDRRRDELAGLEPTRRQLEQELADARRLTEQVARGERPFVLDEVTIASPCRADWAEMSGDDRVRHCGACDKNVYDLSAMTRAEAEAFVRERDGSACVRFYRRADGTLLTSDCPQGRRRRRRRWAIAAAAVAGLGAGTFVAANALVRPTMGAIDHRIGKVVMGLPAMPREIMEEQSAVLGQLVARPAEPPASAQRASAQEKTTASKRAPVKPRTARR